jgi:aryl-alcohol dehydrogenase-like predicted oxidoreductase
VLYIGLSDTPAWQASRMQAIAELRGWTQFCALQISYSLVERTVEREMIPMAREMGLGVSPWAPLGQGVLTGKYTRDDLIPGSMDDISSRKAINAVTGKLTEKNLDIADVVVEMARELNCSPAQLALAWTLVNPAVVSPVVGVRTPAQLTDNLGALDVTLAPEHIARLDEISAVPKVFPLDVLKSPAEGMMFGNVRVEERA